MSIRLAPEQSPQDDRSSARTVTDPCVIGAHGPEAARTDFERDLSIDKIRMLYREAVPSFAGTMLAGALWVCAMWSVVDRTLLLAWLALLAMTTLARAALVLLYRRSPPRGAAVFAWFRRYACAVVASSIIWGLGTTLLVLDAPLMAKLATFAFLVGLCGASLVAYGLFPTLALVVIAFLLVPIELALFFGGDAFGEDPATRWVALGGLMFALSTTRSVFAYGARMEESLRQTYRLREANRVAQWHAETDVLTGLNNRRAFTSAARAMMQLAARERSSVAILVIDLDRFKDINDGYGHPVGDAMLTHVADLMREALRRSDICGRLGGDEFAVLLPHTGLDAAQAVAEKIRALAAQTSVPVEDLDVSVHLSIGIACGSGETFEALLGRADQAMYDAKRMGPNRIVAVSAS